MAKKKQLAGKQTKLAKLPLTRALASQWEEPGPPPAAAAASSVAVSPAPFLGEPVRPPGGGPLAAVYLYLVRELAALRSQLQPDFDPAKPLTPAMAPPLPRDSMLQQTLHQARQGLRDLRRLLS